RLSRQPRRHRRRAGRGQGPVAAPRRAVPHRLLRRPDAPRLGAAPDAAAAVRGRGERRELRRRLAHPARGNPPLSGRARSPRRRCGRGRAQLPAAAPLPLPPGAARLRRFPALPARQPLARPARADRAPRGRRCARMGPPAGAEARRGAGHAARWPHPARPHQLVRLAVAPARRRRSGFAKRSAAGHGPRPGPLRGATMAEISPAALFGKLAEIPYKTLESATEYAQRRRNPNVQLAHWLHQLLQQVNSDLHCAIQHFDINSAELDRDLSRALDKLPRGASSLDFSDNVWNAVQQGWLYATLMFEARQVRTGHLLIGILKNRPLRLELQDISGELRKIRADELAER